MAWYRTGSVNVTNGSAVVQGVGTLWLQVIKAGDIFTTDEARIYEVKSVDSDTQLTLTENYQGATASAILYALIINFTNTTNADLASKISKLVQGFQTNTDEMIGWLSGPAGGGPNKDGTYPITDFYGNVTYVKSAAEFQSEIDTQTTKVNQAVTDSQTAVNNANTAVTNANNAVTTANSAATTAQNAATDAENAATNANNAATSANNAASAANTATTNANNATSAAQTATTDANTATTNANNAASSANSAATSATNAANDATTATTNANNATTSANTATTNANSATGAAQTATSDANTATTNANNAASAANTAATNANNAATAANDAATAANNAAQAKLATASTPGIVQPGTGLAVDSNGVLSVTNGAYTLPAATTTTLGGVKVGANLSVTADGTLSAQSSYTLPTATTTSLGGIKVGTNLSAAADGTLSVSGLATVAISGKYADLTGTPVLATVATSGSYTDLTNTPAPYTLPVATSSTLGGVKQGANTSIAADGAISVSGLATVATSGSYNDLSNQPALGTAAAQNVGTAATNVVQLDTSAKLPAVDGSALTNVNAAQLGGKTVGTAANNIVALDANSKLPAVDGSQLTNLPGGAQPYMIVQDQKPKGTSGGASIAGSQVRTLNTVVSNSISGASLAGNQITLPAGTYRFVVSAPAYGGSYSNAHQVYLQNVTDSTIPIFGTTEMNTYQTRSFVRGDVTITAQKTFQISHYTNYGQTTNGLGFAASDTATGAFEVYTTVEIYKVA